MDNVEKYKLMVYEGDAILFECTTKYSPSVFTFEGDILHIQYDEIGHIYTRGTIIIKPVVKQEGE